MESALLSSRHIAAGHAGRQQVLCAALASSQQPAARSAVQPCGGSRLCDTPAHRDALGACFAVRRQPVLMQAAAAAPAAAPPSQSLEDLRLDSLLNTQGYIDPEVPDGTEATVFAVFDQNRKLQYMGFSKDLRNSLRTLFGRRPDKVFFHKAVHLPKLDQKQMIAIREAWFEEVGGPPIGNKLAMERALWEKPVDGGAISARGKLEAAKSQAATQLAAMRTRGAVEEFAPNPQLLEEGKVDFLPAKALDREAMQAEQARLDGIRKATRTVSTVVDGQQREFLLFFTKTYKTNGGFMFDVRVTFDDRETTHRVICGSAFYESMGLEPETIIERVFAFLLAKKIPRRTEGMMLSSEFPINYFSVSEVEQDWPDEFQAMFSEGNLPGDAEFWRFNKIHEYGAYGETPGFSTTRDYLPAARTTWIDS